MRKKSLGLLEGWVSIGINLLLFALKLWAGITSASVAMVADAWHTLSDSASSVILITGMTLSERSADEKHPFGHGRIDNIAAIIIGTLLMGVGFGFLFKSGVRLWEYSPVEYGRSAVIIFVIAAAVKEGLARFSIWAGRKTRSEALIADGCHHRSDAATTLLILAGIFFGREMRWVDPALGIIVSVVIIHLSYGIIKRSSGSIIGEKMCPEIEREIQEIIRKDFPEVSSAHHFHLHRYGDHSELTFHAHMPDGFTLEKAHGIINGLEERINRQFGIETTIHAGPLSEAEG